MAKESKPCGRSGMRSGGESRPSSPYWFQPAPDLAAGIVQKRPKPSPHLADEQAGRLDMRRFSVQPRRTELRRQPRLTHHPRRRGTIQVHRSSATSRTRPQRRPHHRHRGRNAHRNGPPMRRVSISLRAGRVLLGQHGSDPPDDRRRPGQPGALPPVVPARGSPLPRIEHGQALEHLDRTPWMLELPQCRRSRSARCRRAACRSSPPDTPADDPSPSSDPKTKPLRPQATLSTAPVTATVIDPFCVPPIDYRNSMCDTPFCIVGTSRGSADREPDSVRLQWL